MRNRGRMVIRRTRFCCKMNHLKLTTWLVCRYAAVSGIAAILMACSFSFMVYSGILDNVVQLCEYLFKEFSKDDYVLCLLCFAFIYLFALIPVFMYFAHKLVLNSIFKILHKRLETETDQTKFPFSFAFKTYIQIFIIPYVLLFSSLFVPFLYHINIILCPITCLGISLLFQIKTVRKCIALAESSN